MRKPTTGEPYAGEPHVRFGGRGGESLSYPYVRPRGRFASAVKVRAWVGRSPVIEGNCVVARRGGEQLEVKRQSVG